jgi:carbohydrate kinase (thermoresistant glucokinase family)
MPTLRLIVMGVSGCGKSTVSQALAQRLGLDMVDGDDLHLPESVAKMRSGIALQDVDRWPWLDRIGSHLAGSTDAGPGRVVACSALRRAYRDRIRARAGEVCFVFLEGDFELIAQRMRQRVGHYMQAGLLDSQFQTLEIPGPEETDVITLSITEPVEVLVEQALTALKAHRSSLVLQTSV